MSDKKGWSLRTWLILIALAIIVVIIVGVVWGEGPAAGLLGLLGGGGTLGWRQKRQMVKRAEDARQDAARAREEAEAAAADFDAAAAAGRAHVDRLDREIEDAPARDAADDAAAAARAEEAARAAREAAGPAIVPGITASNRTDYAADGDDDPEGRA